MVHQMKLDSMLNVIRQSYGQTDTSLVTPPTQSFLSPTFPGLSLSTHQFPPAQCEQHDLHDSTLAFNGRYR